MNKPPGQKRQAEQARARMLARNPFDTVTPTYRPPVAPQIIAPRNQYEFDDISDADPGL